MGTLTTYLQQSFAEQCPLDWSCFHEVQLIPAEISKLLGYSSRADVLLEKKDGSRRLWIEFEISRADPVANHAKFATAHLFVQQLKSDSFIAMVSSHVNRGRRNLASNTVHVMRHIGMNAFQTLLFPQLSPSEIKRINHLNLSEIQNEQLPVKDEIDRVLAISETVINTPEKRIHLVGDLLEVILNIRKWNEELETESGCELWKHRTVTYFVFDPYSKNFAPSKFCAYSAIKNFNEQKIQTISEMSVDLYVTLDGTDSRFDGRRAWTHLTKNLAMIPCSLEEVQELLPFFEKWMKKYSDNITVHPSGPIILLPPMWFR